MPLAKQKHRTVPEYLSLRGLGTTGMLKRLIRKMFNAIGYDILRISDRSVPLDMDGEFVSIFEKCQFYTMTSIERMYALYKAVQYVVQRGIPGDLVECGVWIGGSSMICALTCKSMGDLQRKIYMYDTYAGMSEPTDADVRSNNSPALDNWRRSEKNGSNAWCFASLEEVKNNLKLTGYPSESMVFVEGKVEDTIPSTIPDRISLLRLDTDWFESTYHELVHLFPRLSPGGVILIDDYGHWKGAKTAVDKYFQENGVKILLNRIDYTGRIGIKT